VIIQNNCCHGSPPRVCCATVAAQHVTRLMRGSRVWTDGSRLAVAQHARSDRGDQPTQVGSCAVLRPEAARISRKHDGTSCRGRDITSQIISAWRAATAKAEVDTRPTGHG
jgi:hypothetical protein